MQQAAVPPNDVDSSVHFKVGVASVAGFMRTALLGYVRTYWRQYVVIFGSVLLALVFEISVNLSYAPLIDDAIPNRDGRKMVLVLVGLGVLFVLSSAGDIIRDGYSARVATRLVDDLRLKMFRHLQALPASYYVNAQTSDILARFANDLSAIEEALTQALPYGISAMLRTIAYTILLFILDWRMAGLMLIVLPLTFLLPRMFIRRATESGYRRKQDDTAILNTVQEHLGAQAILRALGLHDTAVVAFTRQLAGAMHTSFLARFQQRMVTRTSDIGQWFIYVAVIALGSYLALHDVLQIGIFMSIISILIALGGSISSLAGFVSGLIPAVVSQQRVDELLLAPLGVKDNADALTLPRLSREIRFENVTFGYSGRSGIPNIREASFPILAGQSVAFVGKSGSGKSTTLNLLMRFYDPDEGQVLVDGYDLRHVSQASLRSQIGVVLQETFLFNTTVGENIRLSKPEASDAEVQAAARIAEVHDFVMSLPQGYDTLVGERGGRLSGGQRQRIALARAVLRDPAILLLDEATSALDPETEAAISATLKKLARNRTIVSVTHRLTSVVDMDRIFVLDKGQVVEQGSHRELLDLQGIYKQLWEQQSGFIVSADGRYAEVTATRLSAIPLFARLGDDTREIIAAHFHTENCDAGSTLFCEGDPADRLYIIVRGKVSMSTLGFGQKSVDLPVLQDGDCFGELALLEGTVQPYTARAVLPTLFLTLQRGPFLQLVHDNPSLRKAVEEISLTRSLRLVVARGRRKVTQSPALDYDHLDVPHAEPIPPKEGKK